jgi:hypothetical protein
MLQIFADLGALSRPHMQLWQPRPLAPPEIDQVQISAVIRKFKYTALHERAHFRSRFHNELSG